MSVQGLHLDTGTRMIRHTLLCCACRPLSLAVLLPEPNVPSTQVNSENLGDYGDALTHELLPSPQPYSPHETNRVLASGR